MGRHLALYASGGVAALMAAGGLWGWSSSRPQPVAVRAAPSRQAPPPRSLPRPLAVHPTPSTDDTEADTETAPPVEAPEVDEPLQPAPRSVMPEAPAEELTPEGASATEHPGLLHHPVVPEETPVAPTRPAATPAQPRQVSLVRLRLWSQPGMCADPGQALSARETLGARFRYWDGGERGQFHVARACWAPPGRRKASR